MKPEMKYILMGAVVLAIIGAILWFSPTVDNTSAQNALNKLKIATGFTLLALIFLFGFAVLVYIANGTIDLSDLLSETGDSKGASMSRFQLLIFTLVIALSLFLVTAANMAFPTSIPPEILTLLGISASTYAVSKGIQAGSQSSANTQQPAPPAPAPPPAGVGTGAAAGAVAAQGLAVGAAAGAGGGQAQAVGAAADKGANA
jgi:hypothetical protein